MAAPDFVPVRPGTRKYYESPPRRPDTWVASRPGELVHEGQPHGAALGTPGPDQGYGLKLARLLRDRLHLAPGEHEDDVIAGCFGVALRRAALYGRSPVLADLAVAFAAFGFTNEAPDPELVAFRKPLFSEVANPHHYREARLLANLVPEATLRLTPAAAEAAKDWRSLLGQ